jgi:hypothetical protein
MARGSSIAMLFKITLRSDQGGQENAAESGAAAPRPRGGQSVAVLAADWPTRGMTSDDSPSGRRGGFGGGVRRVQPGHSGHPTKRREEA